MKEKAASPESSDVPDTEIASPNTHPTPPAPPDGGLLAWLQVAAGFLIFFNTWGMLSSFAVFQIYYESRALFTSSSVNISWIGSIQSFLVQIAGLAAGPIYDRGYLRHLLASGSFLVVFGLMMLSLSTQYWQALLAQGFCVGIGAGLLFVPTVSLLPTWFSSRIGLAVGIAAAGSSLGGVVFPIMLSRLISRIGFPWAVRAMAFVVLGTFVLPLVAMRMRVQLPKPRDIVDWKAFRDMPFMTFCAGLLLVLMAQVVILFYVSFYPEDRGITDTSLAFYMGAIFNAGSSLGRIIPNTLSDRIGVLNTLAPLILMLGVTQLCMLAVNSPAGMIVEALVTGFFSGAVVALPPVCFRVLTENKSMIGTRMGQGFAISGLGSLAGGPIAGAILGHGDSLNWTGLWVFGGVVACVSAMTLAGVRVMRGGWALTVKA